MHHQSKNRKFGREKDQRKALIKSLINNIVEHGKIETTEAKAKELRPKIEKLVTKAKNNSLQNRRLLGRYMKDNLAKKMIEEIGPKYKERKGGYTRIIKLGPSQKDARPKAIIEFV